MTLHTTIPDIGKPKTVKDAIILILSREWPLRAKEIYLGVKKHKLNVSFQAVHKDLQWLLKNGILRKEHKSYYLNKIWINKLKKFVERLELVGE